MEEYALSFSKKKSGTFFECINPIAPPCSSDVGGRVCDVALVVDHLFFRDVGGSDVADSLLQGRNWQGCFISTLAYCNHTWARWGFTKLSCVIQLPHMSKGKICIRTYPPLFFSNYGTTVNLLPTSNTQRAFGKTASRKKCVAILSNKIVVLIISLYVSTIQNFIWFFSHQVFWVVKESNALFQSKVRSCGQIRAFNREPVRSHSVTNFSQCDKKCQEMAICRCLGNFASFLNALFIKLPICTDLESIFRLWPDLRLY